MTVVARVHPRGLLCRRRPSPGVDISRLIWYSIFDPLDRPFNPCEVTTDLTLPPTRAVEGLVDSRHLMCKIREVGLDACVSDFWIFSSVPIGDRKKKCRQHNERQRCQQCMSDGGNPILDADAAGDVALAISEGARCDLDPDVAVPVDDLFDFGNRQGVVMKWHIRARRRQKSNPGCPQRQSGGNRDWPVSI